MTQGETHSHERRHDRGESRSLSRRRLWWALGINLAFMLVEVAGGILTNSLALLADAGHMLTDVAALALALFVASVVERPPTPKRTYGLMRAEVLGAFVNGATLVPIVGFIVWEAVRRMGRPVEIDAPLMLAVAAAGLVANLVSAFVLSGSRKESINVRGAFLHMAADALGSVGAIVAGAVIWATGWTPVDPIVSLLIGVLILWSAWGLLKETLEILLEAAPRDIDYGEVKRAMEGIGHVEKVHDLHIWTIAPGVPSLSAHVSLKPQCSDTTHWQECMRVVQTMLRKKFGIVHSTLQLEPPGYAADSRTF